MRKILFYLNLALALALLTGIVYMTSGPGPWALNSEKTFYAAFHNSLNNLDEAKYKWADEKHKSEEDIPTLEDLIPYLEDKGRGIKRFMVLGITYKITSTETNQSDVATLTRDLRFRSGYCLLYRKGTSYSLHNSWTFPPRDRETKSFNTLWIENNLDHALEAALIVLVFGNLFVFMNTRKRNTKQANHAPS
jgi:hypothetical protein